MNLLVAFAVSLKHKLRFEPYTSYDDLSSLVAHLDTFAGAATRDSAEDIATSGKKPGFLKAAGEYLGVSFAASNPRKAIKQAKRPLGNLPLEILGYLASFTDELIQNGQLAIPMQQTLACEWKKERKKTKALHASPNWRLLACTPHNDTKQYGANNGGRGT